MSLVHRDVACLPATLEVPVLHTHEPSMLPGVGLAMTVGRPTTARAVEAALATEETWVGVFARSRHTDDAPGPSDLHAVGTVCKIAHVGDDFVVVDGLVRARVDAWRDAGTHLRAVVEVLHRPRPPEADAQMDTLRRAVLAASARLPYELWFYAHAVDDPGMLADMALNGLGVPPDLKQQLLETPDVRPRVQLALRLLRT
jgi:ATP-dependent Lon protease